MRWRSSPPRRERRRGGEVQLTGLILIRAMRFLSRFMTTKRLPWKVKAWRSSGIDCVSWDKASDGGRLVVGQRPIECPVEVADRDSSVDHHRTVRLLPDTLNIDVVLVCNVADDLLDDVLKRHQTLDLAIFVDDQREM